MTPEVAVLPAPGWCLVLLSLTYSASAPYNVALAERAPLGAVHSTVPGT